MQIIVTLNNCDGFILLAFLVGEGGGKTKKSILRIMLTVLRLLLGAMKLIIMTVFIGIMIIAFFYIPYSARTQRANSIAVIKFWGSVFSPVIKIKECGRFFWPIPNFFHRRKMVLILTLKKRRLFSWVLFLLYSPTFDIFYYL